MAYNDNESRIVKSSWTLTVQGVPVTIPAGEKLQVARDSQSGNVRILWSGFQKKQLGFSAPVNEQDLAAHT